jgi:hypothetical protein
LAAAEKGVGQGDLRMEGNKYPLKISIQFEGCMPLCKKLAWRNSDIISHVN